LPTRTTAGAFEAGGFHVNRNQITLNISIKSIGMHKMPVELHGEVEVEIVVNVARNEDEAVRQARGEDLTLTRSDEEEDAAQAKIDAEKFFEAPPAEVTADGEATTEAEAPAEEKPKAKRAKKAGAEPAEGDAEAKPAREKKAKKEKAAKE
jgi:large subunit ribosomal protein L9